MDLTASSAVNLPITSASLRWAVVRMGGRSIRCTYSAGQDPARFTFTINLVFFMGSPIRSGMTNKDDKQNGGDISAAPIALVSYCFLSGLAFSLAFDGLLAAYVDFDLPGLGFSLLGQADLQHAIVIVA